MWSEVLCDSGTMKHLRDHLIAADYRVDPVLDRITEAGQAGLGRNSTIPAATVLGDADDPQATLIKMFVLGREVPRRDAARALPLARLEGTGLVTVTGDSVRAEVDIRPYGFEIPDTKPVAGAPATFDGWVVSDPTPGLDNDRRPTRPDYVLGVSPASTTLAGMTIPGHVGAALDLGTGCGVQSLHLSTHADRIVATDINPRCLHFARLTAALNNIDVDLRDGSLYEPVPESFDLIVTNPPYVMSPPRTDGRLVYREAGLQSDDLVRQVVTEAPAHLNPGGVAQVLANWAITDDQPWTERVAAWANGGADLWIIERERLDPFAYIEMWLTDAGLAGDATWEARYREWLDYFDALHITGIGMGWITVVNSGREIPDVHVESWPHEVVQPVGVALGARCRQVSAASMDDGELLGARWRIAPGVVSETMGSLGAPDPQYLVMRQGQGLKRATQLTTELAAVLGACDGDLPLGVIIDAVAQLMEADVASLRAQLLPGVRAAIVDDFLRLV